MPHKKRSPRRGEGRFRLGRRNGWKGNTTMGLTHVSKVGEGETFFQELRRRAAMLNARHLGGTL